MFERLYFHKFPYIQATIECRFALKRVRDMIITYSYSPVLLQKSVIKQIFQAKKNFITCSKLITIELGGSPTRSGNDYFANNEQAPHTI